MKHKEFLDNHCRICCNRLRATKYHITDYLHIFKLFGIDASDDDPTVHPKFFCNSCYLTAKTSSKNHPGEPIKRAQYQWFPHADTSCLICDSKCKGGRPKKKSCGGRPLALHEHIKAVASAVPSSKVTDVLDGSYNKEVCCVKCRAIVVKPVEIQPCKSLACSSCCLDLVSDKRCFCCSRAQEVSQKFLKVFTLFSNCHKLYDSSSELSDVQITTLGTQ